RGSTHRGMNLKARQELIGIGALLVGFFLGLTLVPPPLALTGSWGRTIGGTLWQLFGVGAIVVPILGVGWALAAFDRLGALSWGRAAVLGAGLILLVPYGIAVGIGPDRKSTRLNSSHVSISYAVFCLKKKSRTT